MRSNKQKSQSNLPTLLYENKKYETDAEKAELFKNILEKTFSQEEDPVFNNNEFYDQVNDYIDSNKYHEEYENQDNSFYEISISEIKAAIKKSKNNSATGLDGIHNQMLKHLPENFIEYIKILFNKSVSNSNLCTNWKTAKISMINKKDSDKTNPNNYRPISVTSCLGKTLERIIANRLFKFCEEKNIIAYQQ